MKKYLYSSLLLVVAIGLTSCGYSLKELYDRNPYNNVNFVDNYYTTWDKDIDLVNNPNNKILNPDADVKNLEKNGDFVFTEFGDDNLRFLEPQYDSYSYETDLEPTNSTTGKTSYGQGNKLSKIDQSFRYGILSKLYDGQLFCHGQFEWVRVQINEGGFGSIFKKELYSSTYFALSFKASIEFRRVYQDDDGNDVTVDIPTWYYGEEGGSIAHLTDIGLTVTFYLKSDNGYTRVPVHYEIQDVPCNPSESTDKYILFGFKIGGKNVPSLDRCAGISIEYTYEDDLLAEMNANIEAKNLANATDSWFDDSPTLAESRILKGGALQHSLFLYEILFPHSTWH